MLQYEIDYDRAIKELINKKESRGQEMLWNTGDLKGLAKWGNKHATGLLPFGFIGPYYLNNE